MSRVTELTLKLLDATLTEAEGAELDALIGADVRSEAEFLALLELEAELRGARTEFDLADATLVKVQAAQTERTANAVLDEIALGPAPAWAKRPDPRPVSRASRRWRGVAFGAACAAAVVLAVWLGGKPVAELPLPSESDVPAQRAFAKLSRMAGFVEVLHPNGDPFPAEEGSELPAGFTLRTGDDSLATIDLLADNSRFEIESGTVVRFRDGAPANASKPQLFLAAGQLTAAIPTRPDDHPMVVGTPVTDVLARGGLFVVSSAGPDTARVDIKSGKVELVRTAAPKPVPVGVGSAHVTAGFDQVHIEQSQIVDRIAKRTFAFSGARDAVFSPDGSEVWIANARAFTRWSASSAAETSFYAKRLEGAAAFTRDKRHLVTFRGEPDACVLVRSLPDGGEHAAVNVRPNETRFWTVAPDASWLAVVEQKPFKRVQLVDGTSGEARFQHEFEEVIGCVTASPDGRVLAVGLNDLGRGANNKVVLLSATTGERLFTLPTQKKALTAMAYSADGRLLAVGFNGAVQLWDVRTRELLRSITGFERALSCLTFAPDTKRLVAGTQDGYVWVWHTETGKQTQLIEAGGRGVRSVAFAPNGTQLVTVATGAPVAVWDVNPTVPRAAEIQ